MKSEPAILKLEWAMKLPEAWRLFRISWRPSRMLGFALLSIAMCIIATTILWVLVDKDAGDTLSKKQSFADAFLWMMVGWQSILWMFGVPMSAISSVSNEYKMNTWIFQQTTPQSVRKLLLGKLAGSVGDSLTASFSSLPFLLIAMFLNPTETGHALQILVIMFFFAILFSTVCIYLSCISKTQSSPFMIIVAAVLSFIFLMTMSSGLSYSHLHKLTSYGSILNLSPFIIIESIFNTNQLKEYFITFWGYNFDLLPFALILCLCFSLVFFTLAEEKIKNETGTARTWIPTFLIFSFIVFLLLGFLHSSLTNDIQISNLNNHSIYIKNILGHFESRNQSIMEIYFNYCAGYLLLPFIIIYTFFIRNAKQIGEIRPWLYRTGTGNFQIIDLVTTDSPIIFSTIFLLVITVSGSLILCLPAMSYIGFQPFYITHVIVLIVIVLRDALFFQAINFISKKGMIHGVLIYFLTFVAISGIIALINIAKTPLIDLTPLSIFYSILPYASNNKFESNTYFYINTIVVNTIIMLVLVMVNIKLFQKAKARLKLDSL